MLLGAIMLLVVPERIDTDTGRPWMFFVNKCPGSGDLKGRTPRFQQLLQGFSVKPNLTGRHTCWCRILHTCQAPETPSTRLDPRSQLNLNQTTRMEMISHSDIPASLQKIPQHRLFTEPFWSDRSIGIKSGISKNQRKTRGVPEFIPPHVVESWQNPASPDL